MTAFNDPRIDLERLGAEYTDAVLNTVQANLQRTLRTGHQMNFNEPSPAEIKLAAEMLKAGLRFEQEHNIGPYYADFFFPEAALVVEVDGAAYHTDDERERIRDEYLLKSGVRFVRHVRALEVFARVHETIAIIKGDLVKYGEQPVPGLTGGGSVD